MWLEFRRVLFRSAVEKNLVRARVVVVAQLLAVAGAGGSVDEPSVVVAGRDPRKIGVAPIVVGQPYFGFVPERRWSSDETHLGEGARENAKDIGGIRAASADVVNPIVAGRQSWLAAAADGVELLGRVQVDQGGGVGGPVGEVVASEEATIPVAPTNGETQVGGDTADLQLFTAEGRELEGREQDPATAVSGSTRS